MPAVLLRAVSFVPFRAVLFCSLKCKLLLTLFLLFGILHVVLGSYGGCYKDMLHIAQYMYTTALTQQQHRPQQRSVLPTLIVYCVLYIIKILLLLCLFCRNRNFI